MSVANVELTGYKWPTDIFDWPSAQARAYFILKVLYICFTSRLCNLHFGHPYLGRVKAAANGFVFTSSKMWFETALLKKEHFVFVNNSIKWT